MAVNRMPSRLSPDTIRAAIWAFRETGATGAEEDTILAAAEQWAEHAPPGGLPATLGSVDDVRKVCEAFPDMTARAGAGDQTIYQDPRGVQVRTRPADGAAGLVIVVYGRDGDTYTFTGPRIPTAAVYAPVQAARSTP